MSPKLLSVLRTTGRAQHRQKVCSEKRCSVPLTALISSSCMHQDKAPTSLPPVAARENKACYYSENPESLFHITELRHNPHCWGCSRQGQLSGKGTAIWLHRCLGQKMLAKPLEILGGAGEGSSQGLAAARAEVTGQGPTGCSSTAQRITENKFGEI